MSDVAEAVIQSQRVEAVLTALGYDRIAIHQVQQEIADLYQTSTLDWRTATDHILTRCASQKGKESEAHRG